MDKFCGRDLVMTNSKFPGSVFVFRRYWNVIQDPQNPHHKLVAVHVTYNRSKTRRGVATVFTSVFNRAQLVQAIGGQL